MIVIDNCIISSLSKIGRLGLLRHLKDCVASPGAIEEAMNSDIDIIIKSVSAALGDYLEIKSAARPQGVPEIQDDFPGLSYVDSEIIVLCQENRCPMLTDDTKLMSIAETEFDITTYDLCEFMLSLKNWKVLSKDEIALMIRQLEKKDRYKFSPGDLHSLSK